MRQFVASAAGIATIALVMTVAVDYNLNHPWYTLAMVGIVALACGWGVTILVDEAWKSWTNR